MYLWANSTLHSWASHAGQPVRPGGRLTTLQCFSSFTFTVTLTACVATPIAQRCRLIQRIHVANHEFSEHNDIPTRKMKMKADLIAYLNSWTSELYSRADRVRQLIGDAHWLSDGHHKESIIREFLVRHLPHVLSVHRGFVKTVGGENSCSPENDILVSDFSSHPPYFFEGDLQIVPPSSVIASLEIKSTFNKSTISDALSNVLATRGLLKFSANFDQTWSGIYFFHNDRTVESFHETLAAAISEKFSSVGANYDKKSFVKMLPKCITSVSSYITFLSSDRANDIVLRTFSMGNSSLPCSFFDLMASVRSYFKGPVVTDFDEMFEAMDIEAPVTITIYLK
jgi:hypothetical protein